MQDVSLRIPAGTSCALVGTSGSGKSTVFRLLFRAYDPSAGAVLVGGHDIRQLQLDSLRGVLGSVPQVWSATASLGCLRAQAWFCKAHEWTRWQLLWAVGIRVVMLDRSQGGDAQHATGTECSCTQVCLYAVCGCAHSSLLHAAALSASVQLHSL